MTPHSPRMYGTPRLPRRRIKVSMTLSLDIDVVQWLDTIPNRSAFVNSVLRNHIQTSTIQSPEYQEKREKELKDELFKIQQIKLKS